MRSYLSKKAKSRAGVESEIVPERESHDRGCSAANASCMSPSRFLPLALVSVCFHHNQSLFSHLFSSILKLTTFENHSISLARDLILPTRAMHP
ncbi:Uncharacterized protein HZ326_1410 [Fusarium oxysporum f. sp. albedinis]|nr:Uncharacterized protein HZ326_1410 [Fusarium oxysporum f. sp. albedinis]